MVPWRNVSLESGGLGKVNTVLSYQPTPHPKPARVSKAKKRKKNHVHGICPQCGMIFHATKPEHYPTCSGEIPVIMVRKNQTERQLLCMALDQMCRLLTEWRDGQVCVLKDDGGCSAGTQWGHVIPQGSSSYLIYDLGNSFRQCETHNISHRFFQLPYFLWYQKTFGESALLMLKEEWKSHLGYKFGTMELYEKLKTLNELYQNRFSVELDIETLVSKGYYGEIIRKSWIETGRIKDGRPGSL